MQNYFGVALFNPNTGRWHPHCIASTLAGAEGAKASLTDATRGPALALGGDVRIHALGVHGRPEKALGALLDACKADNA